MRDMLIVTLPNGAAFRARRDETLLQAAQRAHWLVRYGCRNGNCEACAATLLQGSVRQGEHGITATAQQQPTVLLCLCSAQTDAQLQLPGNPQHGSPDQAQRRYARLTQCERVDDRQWRLRFALPAGRQPDIYAGQYVLIENSRQPQDGWRAYVDIATRSGRDIEAISSTQPALAIGDYVHLRYPLGYCYIAAPERDALILFEPAQRAQARQLQAQAQHIRVESKNISFENIDFENISFENISFENISFELANNDEALPSLNARYGRVFACAPLSVAQAWFEALLARGIEFAEFRCDDAIWHRWRVRRQDDNDNRFTVAAGLSEKNARALAAEMESRGHKQLYWAEPMLP